MTTKNPEPLNTWYPLHAGLKIYDTTYSIDEHPEIASLMGQLLARWAFLERQLCWTLGHLLDGNHGAAHAIIYALNNFGARLDVCRATLQFVMPSGPEKNGMILLFGRIERLSKTRNKYVHGIPYGGKEPTIENWRTLSTNPVARASFKTSDILAHIQRVDEITLRLKIACDPKPRNWIAPRFLLKERIQHG